MRHFWAKNPKLKLKHIKSGLNIMLLESWKSAYIEVGANTLKSSSNFQLLTKIMFSWEEKKCVFGENVGFVLGEQSTHMYNKIGTNWLEHVLGKSS